MISVAQELRVGDRFLATWAIEPHTIVSEGPGDVVSGWLDFVVKRDESKYTREVTIREDLSDLTWVERPNVGLVFSRSAGEGE